VQLGKKGKKKKKKWLKKLNKKLRGTRYAPPCEASMGRNN
jgi:hypothetical protein